MRDHDHADFVEAQLAATRARIEGARDALEHPVEERGWLAACAEREHELDLRAASAGEELPSALPRARLGLTPTEARILWVLIAHELSPGARIRLRELNTEQLSDVTLDTLRRVTFGSRPGLAVWRELGPDSPLRRHHLIEPIGATDVPEHRLTFRVTRRLLALVHGDLRLDDELTGIAARPAATTAISDLEVSEPVRDRVRASLPGSGNGVTLLVGPSGIGRRSLWLAAARDAGTRVLTLDARKIAPERERAQRQLRIIAREARLLGCVPLFLHLEALGAMHQLPDRLDLLEAELEGVVLATAHHKIARRWRTPATIIEMAPPSGDQRARLWSRALPMASTGDADLLATMYPLSPALITAAGAMALRQAGDKEVRPDHVEAGIRSVLDDRLAGLASRVTVTQTWSDLILHEDQTTAIIELLARIRKRRQVYEQWGFAEKVGRGLGISALFSGPPGTGKTMCAGVIARDLRTELYQVDLSKIVSKWIGETEKNLAAIFDAAEAGHAVLLFDEADALFGKRTEVKSSNDRHANQEVNFLLQRLESYAGICILTTNHEAALDEAFRRRLSVQVRFAMPEADERRRLWRALLPDHAPKAPALNLDALADEYVMSGGYIRNAVLRAAFLAADEESAIGPQHLARAALLEYESMGKIVASR